MAVGPARTTQRKTWVWFVAWPSNYATINARAETVAEKPTYRQAIRRRRCLIPADGFYEWRKVGARKQPYCIASADGAPFAFAGLWERWERDGEVLESCTILVTQANTLLAPIHDRMSGDSINCPLSDTKNCPPLAEG